MGLRAKAVNAKLGKNVSGSGGQGGGKLMIRNNSKQQPTASAAKAAANVGGATCVTTTTTTYRSSSTSAIMAAAAAAANCMRPQTLNVQHLRETPADQTQLFFGEVLSAWRAKARCNVVPADRTQELFHELSFHPSDKQISEMLQTAKFLARKGSSQPNGLTFGEFCVLAADLKRFRSSNNAVAPNFCDRVSLLDALKHDSESGQNGTSTGAAKANKQTDADCEFATSTALRGTKSLSNVGDCQKTGSSSGAQKKSADAPSSPVEVFLGGSCNPTTWRADVAIPALQELGISFYNPQVSDWTPDLIELEHRAKEKARVLFFVMDSETRASAGAIEAAHIAGQNCKQLVLVLHPYKPNQYILNEHISQQEYIDLTRNQMMLQELVTRRGLPVLDNIPSGLQRTKDILAGIRDPPTNIASILVVVRGAFDRVSSSNELISAEQCQRALSYLGYAQSLIKLDNLNKIITSQRESIDSLEQCNSSSDNSGSTKRKNTQSNNSSQTNVNKTQTAQPGVAGGSITLIDFNLFCVISAYLSVLQQEIHESGCISPIKGTNVPPPPIYLSNMQGDESFAISYYANRNISRTPSNNSVPGGTIGMGNGEERPSLNDLLSRSRDSGTSSPQPQEAPMRSRSGLIGSGAGSGSNKPKTQILVNVESIETTTEITTLQTMHTAANVTMPTTPILSTDALRHADSATTEEESDSNDSVFSSNSSINSVSCNYSGDMLSYSGLDFREVYLGGSCALRSKWRDEVAIPYLKAKGITYHIPALHESLPPATVNDLASNKSAPQAGNELPIARAVDTQERTFTTCTRRQCHGGQLEEEEEEITTVSEESFSWAPLPRMRLNLYNPVLLDSSRILLFVITNETRSLAPMTLAAHCIGLMYNVVLAVQMLPDDCVISNEKLTPAAIKDYNRGRSYLIDLAKRQGVPVFIDLKAALECTVEKVKACNSRHNR